VIICGDNDALLLEDYWIMFDVQVIPKGLKIQGFHVMFHSTSHIEIWDLSGERFCII